jgi:hypothetical protein
MAKTNKQRKTIASNAGEDSETLDHSHIVGENVK